MPPSFARGFPRATFGNMIPPQKSSRIALFLFCGVFFLPLESSLAQSPARSRTKALRATPVPKIEPRDDSLNLTPPADLALRAEGDRKARALAQFVEGQRLEEEGELDEALEAYIKVLNVDPGEITLASHVAALLTRQEDFPRAIDVLKDAIKAKPKASGAYLQLAELYARYLKKLDQALKYANQAVALDPQNIEAYQRIYEMELAAGRSKQAHQALERAATVNSNDADFWLRLGKLYAAAMAKAGETPDPAELERINAFFAKATGLAGDDAALLKEVADFFAASRQIEKALPLYLRVLELRPDDSSAQEKLATGFVLTNQRPQAIEMLQQIIKEHPAKYQAYELLADVYEDEGRALERANQREEARANFAKAAANYEQCLLIIPNHSKNYFQLAELFLGRLKEPDRAVKLLTEARRRFPGTPGFAYYLGLALREAKRPKEAVTVFEEALHEAELNASEMVNARFYFDYGATAEQAGLYDKAADLFKRSIALDPANAEAYNYLGFMWADQNMHLEEAEEMINRALQIDPNNGAYLDSIGWLHYRRGKFEQALTELLRAAQNLPKGDPTVFEHIGDTCAKLERIPQALDYWQKAAALDPANKQLAAKIESTKTKVSKGGPAKDNPKQ
jgi:tetratricopeptide (TPR) repeat protein